jgi:hypothetical protein
VDALAELLKPDGALLLVETLRNEPWHLVTMGFTAGFLDYIDERSRAIGPFLSLEEWKQLLGDYGLVCFIADEAVAEQRGQTMIFCTRKQQERAI